MLKKVVWILIPLYILLAFSAYPGLALAAVIDQEERAGQEAWDDGAKEETIKASRRNQAISQIEPRRYHHKGDDLVRKTGKECRECHVSRWYPQKDPLGWETRGKWRLHWTLFSLAAFVMLVGLYSAVSIWTMGRGRSFHHAVHWPSAMRAVVWEVLLGQRIWRQSRVRWAIFSLISVAFVMLAVVFGLTMIQRFILEPGSPGVAEAGLVLDFLADFLGGCILLGSLLALFRRLIGKEKHLKSEPEDYGILLLILGIVITGFFLESCRLAVVSPEPEIWASFIGALGGSILRQWDLPWVAVRFYVWIVHAVLVFGLFAYLPFSKLFHVMTSPLTIVATASEAHYRQHL